MMYFDIAIHFKSTRGAQIGFDRIYGKMNYDGSGKMYPYPPEIEHYTNEANIFVAVVTVGENGVHIDMGKLNGFYRLPNMRASARELYTVLGDIKTPGGNAIQLDRSEKRKIDRLIAIGEFIQNEELNGTHTDLEAKLKELRQYQS
ncbi:hypothetical protein DdX_19253 [Ditylenchus destructor]|uniref:Uncharacterized protein n=1 Tax=Ditylenchus destructor TaxID=166010 RepID=A0AAD4QXF0_9BILA|nr:hypothetical protein DdX_19253 [Ditylenchus destructor]